MAIRHPPARPDLPPPQPLSRAVLAERYLAPDEESVEDVQWRVADALGQCESEARRDYWVEAFFRAQAAGFIAGGRINAHAGIKDSATLVNCFVQPCTTQAGGVNEALGMALATLAAGGGVGYDFSAIGGSGPDGESGPVAAIRRFDLACGKLASDHHRRCAQMAVLRCDHPDILAFIAAKARGGLTNFNTSVALTDAFMEAVVSGGQVAIGGHAGQTLAAREIWRELVAAACARGEPGVLFVNTINRDNNLGGCETIAATNPCGEQPLPEFGACVLGSVNLARFVKDAFRASAWFDWGGFAEVVAVATRMLDNVLDLTHWPLSQQRDEAMTKRRIGLGITGLADALLMLGLDYGEPRGRQMARQVVRVMRNRAYLASVKLAMERGAFAALDVRQYLAPKRFASRLPSRLQQLIRRVGIRNSHLLAIAPTGSISLAFADNVSNGIEPVFAWQQQRRMRLGNNGVAQFDAENFAWRLYRHMGGDVTRLPASFVTAATLPLRAHLDMLAALAPLVDAGISKTVNLPPGTGEEEVEALFIGAWRAGVKGLTCFPARSPLGAVLKAR